MSVSRRALTEGEIRILESRGCSAQDWSKVTVADGFDPLRIKNVTFSGEVSVGRFDGVFHRPGGLERPAGITDATLHNVSVGDGVYISKVSNYIANYDIADGVYIDNIGLLVGTLDSTFGIGTEVSVLNETGGREVPVYERMSAQTAYLVAMYRHRSEMVRRLVTMVKVHADRGFGRRGTIGRCCEIVNAGAINNVNIGEYARIKGVARLTDGTISSVKADPVFVGRDVIAEGFIFASGAKVDDGAVITHCFVGQASQLSHLFSAHDSLFFANCACENGEAAAIFGGPYTVTMHKSSLLIAGMFSFLNAGSGSNQSNHMYKLGPIHQGMVERGSKTTSDSYILWPARIGAFSLVMGRHVNHPDTSALPFSYLIENRGRSFLVPGVNIKSVGTIRDAQKWPKRDRRKPGSPRLDAINFNLLSPYTISKMLDGIKLLDTIEQTTGLTADQYAYHSMTIDARALRKGRDYYRMAIDKFFGNSIIHRLRETDLRDADAVASRLQPTAYAGRGEWLDIAGMIAPQTEIDRLCADIADGKIASLAEAEKRIHEIADDYYDMEWTWVADNFKQWFGKECSELTAEDLAEIADRWQQSVVRLDNMLYDDARKEFSLISRIGFGADGTNETQAADFEQVRGDFENDPFARMVLDHIAKKSALADNFRRRLKAE